MGSKDDDRRDDLDKWFEAQRTEFQRCDDLLGQRTTLEKDIRSSTDDTSASTTGPFERFKNFVDSNITTLSEGFKNFPSNISELKARMQQEREARREEESEIWRRWTGSEDSPDHIRMQIERSTGGERELARDAVFQLLKAAYEKNKHVPPHKIVALYRDSEWSFGGLDKFANPMLSSGGACYYKPETVDNLPSTARWGWPAPSPQWLSVDWFKRSPYSPISLEAYPGLQDQESKWGPPGSKWRAAFEDLLSASLDKPMVSEEKIGQRSLYGTWQSTYYGPGLEWMLSLQCRGILPPQLPSLYKPVSLFDGFDEVKRPRTTSHMHDVFQSLDSPRSIDSNPTPIYPQLKKDMEALIDEVSIKSGPETAMAGNPRSSEAAPWRVPDTEQDLYDEMPPREAVVDDWQAQFAPYRQPDFLNMLVEALAAEDLSTVAEVLSDYYGQHESIANLIENVLDDLEDIPRDTILTLICAALTQSDIPKSDRWVVDALEESQRMWEHDEAGMCENLTLKGFERHLQLRKQQHMQKLLKARQEEEETLAARAAEAEEREKKIQSASEISKPSTRPDILAQLTTTKTTRLPDGTVTTKVVLKQSFADGTEEEHETVHTSREPRSDSVSKKESEPPTAPEKKKSGWFWS